MAIHILEKTECYKCGCEIMARQGEVHPLCVECESSFDDWFAEQLRAMEKR